MIYPVYERLSTAKLSTVLIISDWCTLKRKRICQQRSCILHTFAMSMQAHTHVLGLLEETNRS